MRQIGVIRAAALIGLHDNVPKLIYNHKRAKSLADGLNQIKGLKVNINTVETNVVYVEILKSANITVEKLCNYLEEKGILTIQEYKGKSPRIRFQALVQFFSAETTSSAKDALDGRIISTFIELRSLYLALGFTILHSLAGAIILTPQARSKRLNNHPNLLQDLSLYLIKQLRWFDLEYI